MNNFKKLLAILFLATGSLCAQQQVEFEIIIPSYNNERWCIANLLSAVNQKYPHFHITYIDDCSTDATGEIVDLFIKKYNLSDKISVIHNSERKGALENLYDAIHACDDERVIITLDGDDQLAHNDVLQYLANIYATYNVWITYGQFQEWPAGHKGFCQAMPADIVKKNAFRQFEHLPSHLRTFYAWLFKKIRKEDLIDKGKFFVMTWDQAMMFPMMEMAQERHAFIPEVLYLYNAINTISDHRVNPSLQVGLAQLIRSKEPYARITLDDELQNNKPLYKAAIQAENQHKEMTRKEKRAYYKNVKKMLKRRLGL